MIFKKIFLIISLAAISAFLVMFLFGNSASAVAPKKNSLPSDYETGITWKEAQKSDKPMVVNFYVDWCNVCRRFAPIFDGYRKQYSSKYNFVSIKSDSLKNEKIVRQFFIPGYPTVYLVDKKRNKKIRMDFKKYFDEQEFKKELEAFLGENIKK